MDIKEFTVSMGPTVVIGNEYIKAHASITFKVDENEVIDKHSAFSLLSALYCRTLLTELTELTEVKRHKLRVNIIKYLKDKIGGKPLKRKNKNAKKTRSVDKNA